MAINIAIVEDEDEAAATLESYINKHSQETGEVFSVARFKDGDEITYEYKPLFDIIFMDIQMKRMDGMSAAEYIRKFDKNVSIVFITNMAQYAISGYAVGALDFVLKPVSYFAFSEQLKRSVEQAKKKDTSYLLLPVENGVAKFSVNDIIYIESVKHKCEVHTATGVYPFVSTIKDLETKLKDKNFFRCNNCYLVNLAYVRGVSGYTLYIDKYELIISRPRKKAFMEALTAFVGGS